MGDGSCAASWFVLPQDLDGFALSVYLTTDASMTSERRRQNTFDNVGECGSHRSYQLPP
jgi:hypothetical protein